MSVNFFPVPNYTNNGPQLDFFIPGLVNIPAAQLDSSQQTARPIASGLENTQIKYSFKNLFDSIFKSLAVRRKKPNKPFSDTKKISLSLPATVSQSKLYIDPMLSNPYQTYDYEYGYRIPKHWILNKDLHSVDLADNSLEYNCVLNYLIQCSFNKINKVVSLKRIQNKRLYIQYQALKEDLTLKYSDPNELTLFHGTREENIAKICEKGFNRSYAKVCLYGKGVYFSNSAFQASLYSQRSQNGFSYVFICKVLIGSFEVGCSDTAMPKRADSTVNDMKSPSVFVTYNDSQVYPEYLLTYK